MSQMQAQKTGSTDRVVDGGYCTGCGVCAASEDAPYAISLDNIGRYQAVRTDGGARSTTVCPFQDGARNEDEIGKALFAPAAQYHDQLGYYLSTFAGHVAEGDFRGKGSAGGMGKWMLCELLREGMVDAVVHVTPCAPSADQPVLYRYAVASTVDEVRQGAPSAYHPVEMSGVLKHIRENPGRYAVVGVPCFIKAIRLLAEAEPVFAERISYCIGLFCGHFKSTRYADMLGWQNGIAPGDLTAINFRAKLPGAKANEKGVRVTGQSGGEEICREAIVQDLFGTNYGFGFFKYKGCDYCDDVAAETADISFGDAWLPQYVEDGRGTNAVVVRHPALLERIEAGIESGILALHSLSADDVAYSQAPGFRHRRDGLAYRLHLADQAGKWRPTKRVKAGKAYLSRRLKRIHRFRIRLAKGSHKCYQEALDEGSYQVFEEPMKALSERYEKQYKITLLDRIAGKLDRILSRLGMGKREAG